MRERPQSRKPGFSRNRLAAKLGECEIASVPMGELGTPPDVWEAYKRSGDFARLKADYAAHLRTVGPAINEVEALLRASPSALFCFERDPAACHRSILCERLEAMGVRFVHV